MEMEEMMDKAQQVPAYNNKLIRINLRSLLPNTQAKAALYAASAVLTVLLFVMGVVGLPGGTIHYVPSQSPRIVHAAKIFFEPSQFAAHSVATADATHTANKTTYLYVDSAGNKLGRVDVSLSYDPQVIQNVSFIPEDFSKLPYDIGFTVVNGTIDRTRGKIAYSIISHPKHNNIPVPPVIRIATITFAMGKSAKTLFSFLPGTNMYALDESSTTAGVNGSSAKPQKSILQQVIPAQAH